MFRFAVEYSHEKISHLSVARGNVYKPILQIAFYDLLLMSFVIVKNLCFTDRAFGKRDFWILKYPDFSYIIAKLLHSVTYSSSSIRSWGSTKAKPY